MPTIQLKGNGKGLQGLEPSPHKGEFGLVRLFMAALNRLPIVNDEPT
jgi:hypothetical protein